MVSPASRILYRHQQPDSIMNKLLEKATAVEGQIKSDPGIKRIVVATDLSDHSIKTTEYALPLAKHFCASLTLVHVFEHLDLKNPGRFAEPTCTRQGSNLQPYDPKSYTLSN
jgi:hypothetical protein